MILFLTKKVNDEIKGKQKQANNILQKTPDTHLVEAKISQLEKQNQNLKEIKNDIKL